MAATDHTDRFSFAQDPLEPAPLAPDPNARYAVVAVERGLDTQGLTYRQTQEPLAPGDRVEVPLGRGNSKTAGLVLETGGPELLGEFSPARVKAVLRRTGQGLPPHLIPLARWISDYYLTPLGMVAASMVPAAVKQSVGRRTRTVINKADSPPDPGRLPPATAKAWDAIRALPASAFPADPAALTHAAGSSNAAPINRLIKAGLLETAEVEDVRIFGSATEETLLTDAAPAPPTLTETQTAVVNGIDQARQTAPFGIHLIRGVTGSGKTEVYIRLLQRALAESESSTAIVLVPEIALTPQTAGRFVSRFTTGPNPIGVEVLHSGLSASARHHAWDRLATGQSRIAVGARSVVFAPLNNLALIIVDEEHDSSYKQDQLPRYNARDVAIKRAQLASKADSSNTHCHAVLGSATPSLESWANAQPNRQTNPAGKPPRYTLWELPHRVAGAMPNVRIVGPRSRDGNTTPTGQHTTHTTKDGWIGIGPILANALTSTLAAGGQAILLLNRRGFASYVACPNPRCGWTLGCDACDARMVVHRAGLRPGQTAPRGVLRCHHCLAERLIPKRCPDCPPEHAKAPILFGLGIQRVEAELTSRFNLQPDTDFTRLDSDSVSRAADYFRILDRFAKGELRCLLGTQMVAKGLDFPNVRLVGVINADTSLTQPDFRAAERTFQLVSQVAGRAGRGDDPGTVIVQTMHPGEPAIALAARHDYPAFAEGELTNRADNHLPPITRMARVVCRDPDPDKAEQQAQSIAEALRAAARNPELGRVLIDGPMPCPISRIADHFRIAVEITAQSAAALSALLTTLRSANLLKSDARTAVDIDPVSLM